MPTVGKREEDRTVAILAIALVGSLAFHLGGIPGFMNLASGLGWLTPVTATLTPPPVDVEMISEEEEPEPEPEPVLDPEPEEPEPEPVQQRRAAPEEPAPAAEPEQEQPEEVQPLDFTGITLTSEGTSGFAVNGGDGTDREGPIGPAPRRATSPSGMGTGGGGGEEGATGPRVVAIADLRRRPEPPSGALHQLERCQVENYPAQARRQGVEALVRGTMRINADGSTGRVRVRSESVTGFGFGRVCARCFADLPDWSPPLDARGNPVATNQQIKCDFGVRY